MLSYLQLVFETEQRSKNMKMLCSDPNYECYHLEKGEIRCTIVICNGY
jgi:hypothetical protein